MWHSNNHNLSVAKLRDIQSRTKVWTHPVTSLMDKDKKMKLGIPLQEIKLKYFVTNYTTLPIFLNRYFLGIPRSRSLIVINHKVTLNFKGIHKRRRTAKTRAFYLNQVKNSNVLQFYNLFLKLKVWIHPIHSLMAKDRKMKLRTTSA